MNEDDLSRRIEQLSPSKRKLLSNRLQAAMDKAALGLGILHHPASDISPLSPIQEEIFFLQRFAPDSPAYNRPLALLIRGKIVPSLIERALAEIVRRHAILRSVYRFEEYQPKMVTLPELSIELPVIDFSNLPERERRAEAVRFMVNETQRVFRLDQSPLLRSKLIQLNVEEHILFLVFHHIAFDAWSAQVLTAELLTLYHAYMTGSASPLPEPPIQYRDFSIWQLEQLNSKQIRNSLDYWRVQLQGLPDPVGLSEVMKRDYCEGFLGNKLAFEVSDSLIAGLKALAIRQEATLFMLLLAAYFVLVCRYSGKVDLSIGTPVAGRTAPETEKLIGLFINTLVLRCDLSGNPAFIELVRQVRNTTLDALAHQDLPFSSLVRELNPRRLPGRSPFFRAFLNVKNIPAPTVSAPGLQFEPFDFDDHLIQNDLTLEVEFSPRRSSFAWKYATELYEPAAIECMAVHYRNILEAATRKPEIRLDQLLFLDKPGRG